MSLIALCKIGVAGNVIRFSEDLKGRDREDAGEMADPEPSAESLLIASGERQQLVSALGELTGDYREVIVLRELEGLSYNEIAHAIDAPVGTVMSRLSRGRAELREALDGASPRMNPMQCRDAHEALNSLIDGETAAEQQQAAAVHLASCPMCTARAREYRRMGEDCVPLVTLPRRSASGIR